MDNPVKFLTLNFQTYRKVVNTVPNTEKRFPADTTLEIKTFLNNPHIDGELYALLMAYSIGENKETRVYKSDLPSQSKIAE